MSCKNCGKEFKPKNKIQAHCSNECRVKWKNRLQKERGAEGRKIKSITYICQNPACGKEYHPRGKQYNTYCSQECSWEVQKTNAKGRTKVKYISRPKKTVTCVICGKEYGTWQSRTKTCADDDCKKQYALNREIEKHSQAIKPRQCKECGKVFTPEYGNKKRDFCSDECGTRYGRREAKRTRRARKRNAFIAPVNRSYIYKRDKGICQLCGKHVDIKLIAPHLMSATLDHIIPLAKGGTHEPKNIQLAHFICNSLKGDRLTERGEQLLLFG